MKILWLGQYKDARIIRVEICIAYEFEEAGHFVDFVGIRLQCCGIFLLFSAQLANGGSVD